MIDRFLLRMSRLLAYVAGVGLLLMMGQTVVDVLSDNVLGRPIPGNLEIISVYHMVLVVFLPLALVEWQHQNIHVDLFFLRMPKPVQRFALVVGYVVCAAFFFVLAWRTLTDAVAAWHKNELKLAAIYLVIWPAKFVLPIGFLGIALVSLRHAWRALRDPIATFEPDSTELQS